MHSRSFRREKFLWRVPEAFFTPEVLAKIDAAAEAAKTGKSYTLEEVAEHFRKKSEDWKREHGEK